MKEERVLIIDDDKDILELLEYNLSREGYFIEVVDDPQQSLSTAAAFQPTLIILDAVMPACDGFSVCRQFRETIDFAQTPIFILTALVESHYEELAFKSGADDFIHKMLGLRSLTKRIELVVRKKLIIQKRKIVMRVGAWQIDRLHCAVSVRNKTIRLSKEEFEIFYFIAQNANRNLNFDAVEQVFSGSNLFQFNVSIETCMRNIFAKTGSDWLIFKGKSSFQFNSNFS